MRFMSVNGRLILSAARAACECSHPSPILVTFSGLQSSQKHKPLLISCSLYQRRQKAYFSETSLGAKKLYVVQGEGRGCGTSVKTKTGHFISTDVPNQMGGKDRFPQPVEYLLASFIGCTQATASFVGRNMKPRILIDHITFDIEGERNENGALANLPITEESEFPPFPAQLLSIKGTIFVFVKDRNGNFVEIKDKELHLLEKHTELRCPVASMVKASGCYIDVKWFDGSKKKFDR